MKAATRLREPRVRARHRLPNHALEWTVQGYVHGSNASSGLDKGTHTRPAHRRGKAGLSECTSRQWRALPSRHKESSVKCSAGG